MLLSFHHKVAHHSVVGEDEKITVARNAYVGELVGLSWRPLDRLAVKRRRSLPAG